MQQRVSADPVRIVDVSNGPPEGTLLAQEDTPPAEGVPNDAFSSAYGDTVNTPLPPVPELAERYTTLFVAGWEGRDCDSYHSFLNDPDKTRLAQWTQRSAAANHWPGAAGNGQELAGRDSRASLL
jgi:hypothetical protein